MTGRTVTLAAEGFVDAAVLRRLARDAGLEPGVEHGGRGKQHLDGRITQYNQAASRHPPWIVGRDLDKDAPCPGEIVRRILPKPARFMTFCIAVRTIEAWLLADPDAFAQAFRVVKTLISREPERLDNPKGDALRVLARSSSRDIRAAMVRTAREGALRIGPEYNARLSAFVESDWRPATAELRAPSLKRARQRIAALAG